MVEIEIHYEGDLHCRAIHKPSGAEIQTDAPVDNHGRGASFSPTDLATAALGTCMATLMGIAAKQHGIDIQGTRVVIRKAMSQDAPRRITRLEVDYFVPLPADHPQRKLFEAAALGCPVHHSLHPDIEQKIAFYYQA
jgi:putative redox protein